MNTRISNLGMTMSLYGALLVAGACTPEREEEDIFAGGAGVSEPVELSKIETLRLGMSMRAVEEAMGSPGERTYEGFSVFPAKLGGYYLVVYYGDIDRDNASPADREERLRYVVYFRYCTEDFRGGRYVLPADKRGMPFRPGSPPSTKPANGDPKGPGEKRQ